jgi:hypothetical protein
LNRRSILRKSVFSGIFFVMAAPLLFAEAIPVHHAQGLAHGFLTVRSEAGLVLAHGDLIQVTSGDRVTTHLTFRFRDGSVDDDTAIYTQRDVFRLISDHHIQHGPFFPKPTDLLIEANQQVTFRSIDKDGKEKVEVNHIDLPPDISNGLIEALLLNVPHDAPEFRLGLVAPTGKGRLIKLAITPAGAGSFSLVGVHRTASIFRIHPELGGVAGVVAPIINKQPSDIFVWILEGEAPAFVRLVGQLSEGGPIVSVELAGTVFSHSPPAKQ